MNEKKLKALKQRQVERKRQAELLDKLEQATDKLSEDRQIEVQSPEVHVEAPQVEVKVDNSEISQNLNEIVGKIEGIKLEAPDVDLSGLELAFKSLIEKVTKATDDIYARYDYSDMAVEPDGTYIGYVAQSGDWFIQKIVGADQSSSSRFAVGKKGTYRESWGKKRSLKYKLRSEVYIP